MAPFVSSPAGLHGSYYTGTQNGQRRVLLPPLEEADFRKSKVSEDESESDQTDSSRSGLNEGRQSSDESLVAAFAMGLCRDMELHGSLEGDRERMLNRLHILLKGFSTRLQNARLSPEQQSAAKFVRQQQEAIAHQVRKIYASTAIPKGDVSTDRSHDGMTVLEKPSILLVGEPSTPLENGRNPIEPAPHPPPRYQKVRNSLRESPAYTWLLDQARVCASLTKTAGSSLETINTKMDDLFQAMEDRSLGGPVFDARIEIEWDLLGFLRRQKYDAALDIAVERAITLTGSAKNAQAMTCLDYMSQTWPVIGEEIVKVLQKALKATNLSCKTRLSDGTELEVSFQSSKARILARGSRSALTELCEQFSWLGAALGPGPEDASHPSTVWLVTPIVSAFNSGELHTNPPSITVRIRFSTRSIPNGSLAHGACWHALFHHPVVVNGFPIRSRRNGERGLEASTALMGALAEARYVAQYAETLVLKGFCSMLVPTAHTESSITWHFVYNKDLSWLPYSGFRRECPEVVANDVLDSDMLNAGNKRNFVGWASSISRNLGTETALYQEIRPAGAPESSTKVASEKKLTISVSKLFGTSDSFVRGQRDKSIISSSASYTGQVYAARRIPVLLYDVATKRGWLVDGASALLHIARSQVEHPPLRDVSHFNDRAVNKRIPFKHPDARGGPEAASHTLTDEDNQRHIIIREFDRYEEDAKGKPKEKMSYRCFKDIVSATWDTLDKIYSAQDEVKKSAKQQLKNPFQKGIEGYEFMGIVSPHGPLTRRKVNLLTNGAEWSEFVGRINAITLFGRNFGEVYEPTAEANLCTSWRTVPVDQEYLTVPVSLLKELKEYTWEDGKIEEDSPEIIKHVLWTPSEDAFKQCGGKPDECTRELDDHVQLLMKTSRTASGFFEIARQKGNAHEEDYLPMKNGAVIFGKSSRLIQGPPPNSGYDSSQVGSILTEPAERNGSSSMMAFPKAGIQSTSTFQERDDDDTSAGMSSPRAMSPLSGAERPFTGIESSRIGSPPASSEATASESTLASQTAQQSPAPAATRRRGHRKALKLREALLKFRTWKQKIRPRATVK